MSDDTKVEIVITGEVDDSVSSGIAQVGSMVQALISSVDEIGSRGGASVEILAGAFSSVTGGSAQTATALEAVIVSVTKIGEAGGAGATELSSGLEKASGGAHEAESAMSRLHLATSGAVQSYIELGKEALSGNFSRLPETLMSVATETGALDAATEALGAAFGPVGVVVAAVGTALLQLALNEYEAEKNTQALAAGFSLSGKTALASADAVRAELSMLEDMPDVTEKAAQGIVEAEAAHAEWSNQLNTDIDQLAPLFAKRWGDDAPKALTNYKEALNEIANGSLPEAAAAFDKLDKKSIGLTEKQREQIALLLATGQQAKAYGEINEDVARRGGTAYLSLGQQINQVKGKLTEAERELNSVNVQVSGDANPMLLLGIELAAARAQQKVDDLSNHLKTLQAEEAQQDAPKLKGVDYIQQQIEQIKSDYNLTQAQIAAKLVQFLQQELHDTLLTTAAMVYVRQNAGQSIADNARQISRDLIETRREEAENSGAIGEALTQKLIAADRADLADARVVAQDKVDVQKDLASKTASLNRETASAAARVTHQATVDQNRETETAINAAREAANGIVSSNKLSADEKIRLANNVWQNLAAGARLNAQQLQQVTRDETDEETQIRKRAAAEQEQLDKTNLQTQQALAKDVLAQNLANADVDLAYMRVTEAQKTAIQAEAIRKQESLDVEAVRKEQAEYKDNPTLYAEYQDKIVQIQAAADTKIVELNDQAALRTLQQWKEIIAPIESAFEGLTNTLITQGGSFGKAMKQEMLQVVASFVSARIKIEFDWLAGKAAMELGDQKWAQESVLQALFASREQDAIGDEALSKQITQLFDAANAQLASQIAQTGAVEAGVAARTAAQTAGAAAGNAAEASADSTSILNSAYTAAASAFKWVMNEVPFPVNVALAPVVAAGTFAAVAAYDVISAAGGAESIPADGQLIIGHKDESVLPARIALPLMDLVSNSEAIANIGAAAQAGAIHVPTKVLDEIRAGQSRDTSPGTALTAGSVVRTAPFDLSGPISSGSTDVANRSEAPGGFFGTAIHDIANALHNPAQTPVGTSSSARGGDTYVIQALDTSDFRSFLSKSANRRAMADIARDRRRAGERV